MTTIHPKILSPVYAAIGETVDKMVGKIFESLLTSDLEEKTISIFTSDKRWDKKTFQLKIIKGR